MRPKACDISKVSFRASSSGPNKTNKQDNLGGSEGCLLKECLNWTQIPKVGIPKARIPKMGVQKAGIPKAGVPKVGKTHTGTLPETETPKFFLLAKRASMPTEHQGTRKSAQCRRAKSLNVSLVSEIWRSREAMIGASSKP